MTPLSEKKVGHHPNTLTREVNTTTSIETLTSATDLLSNVCCDILHNSIYSWQTSAGLGYNKTHIIVYNQMLLALHSHYILVLYIML